LRIISTRNLDALIESRKPHYNKKLAQSIIDQVKSQGDVALRRLEKRFDGADLTTLRVSKDEITRAYGQVTGEQLSAVKLAKSRLAKTEMALKKQLTKIEIKTGKTKITRSFEALDSVGCYVPGGLARYPSTAVMSVMPAKIAGVKKIVVATPPSKQGKVDPLTLVAADLCGADDVFKVGGAQAIAALAVGTKTIPKVDKIVGPGGALVTATKYLVSEITSIDMLAGPTELAVIADAKCNAEQTALDLISQAEHSPDTMCCLVTTSKNFAKTVIGIIEKKLANIDRKEIVAASLAKNGFVVLCKNVSEMIDSANKIAPEHLQLVTKNADKLAGKIKTAGLVLVGPNTPSSASDYLLGTNHILPTGRFGKSRSSLSVLDFVKIKTTATTSKEELEKIHSYLMELTISENLPNHYAAVRSRI
jgi:histidinol dehydrogenase